MEFPPRKMVLCTTIVAVKMGSTDKIQPESRWIHHHQLCVVQTSKRHRQGGRVATTTRHLDFNGDDWQASSFWPIIGKWPVTATIKAPRIGVALDYSTNAFASQNTMPILNDFIQPESDQWQT